MGDDDLMALTTVMEMNGGVLRQRDHLGARATFARLVRSGAIVRVLPGTYVDAARLTERHARCAAALAFAPGSLLWGSDAVAAHTGSLAQSEFGEGDRVLLAHGHSRRPAPGVRWVRRSVPADQRVRVNGLRCPSAAYLAVEAAARDDGDLIQRFLRERRTDTAQLAAALSALAGTPGQETRRRVVRASRDNPWSGGERALQALLRRHRLTGWSANLELVVAGRRYYPDVCWPERRLIVEFDGYGVHSEREQFETDRWRQNHLVLAGYTVLRFTWRQLQQAPNELIGQIRAGLARETAPHQ
ncbi:MAG: DUF559 domain-containing protein [Micropruina sp.]|nr:DUF559 domain-containing protein [Micropruina sp.]